MTTLTPEDAVVVLVSSALRKSSESTEPFREKFGMTHDWPRPLRLTLEPSTRHWIFESEGRPATALRPNYLSDNRRDGV